MTQRLLKAGARPPDKKRERERVGMVPETKGADPTRKGRRKFKRLSLLLFRTLRLAVFSHHLTFQWTPSHWLYLKTKLTSFYKCCLQCPGRADKDDRCRHMVLLGQAKEAALGKWDRKALERESHESLVLC